MGMGVAVGMSVRVAFVRVPVLVPVVLHFRSFSLGADHLRRATAPQPESRT